ncbi:MAG: hypothetical protein ABJB34_09145, partial [Acidobacteriota bacterium]
KRACEHLSEKAYWLKAPSTIPQITQQAGLGIFTQAYKKETPPLLRQIPNRQVGDLGIDGVCRSGL